MIANSVASFSVQSPWAFTALLAVIVPLVLHLINKSQAKEIKFANIALIAALKPKIMREFRLNECWLLLLRIVLLVVSVLLLANIINRQALISDEAVQVVTTDWLNESNNSQRQQLATSSADTKTYLLADNNKRLSASEILAWPIKAKLTKKSDGTALTNKANKEEPELGRTEISTTQYENTLQQLSYFSETLSEKTKITAFVTDRANQYQLNNETSNIALDNSIDWQILTIAESHYNQYNAPINVLIIYDQDRAVDIKYFQQALALLKQQTAPNLTFSYWLNDGVDSNAELEANTKLDTRLATGLDTELGTEAGLATDEALREQKNTVSYQQALQKQPDWLFYLSSKNIDHNITNAMAMGTRLFVDAQNADNNLMLSQTLTINKDSADLLQSDATFYQRALPLDIRAQLSRHQINNPLTKSEEVLWQFIQEDGSTRPMLNKLTVRHNKNSGETSAGVNKSKIKSTSDVYQFYSRFSPSWSDLLVTKQFPLFLKRLLFQNWQNDTLEKQQRLSREQIIQRVIRPESTEKTAVEEASKQSTQQKVRQLSGPKSQPQNQQAYYAELLIFLFILLLIVERIASEYFRPKMFTENNEFQDKAKTDNEINVDGANVDGDSVQAVTTAKAVE
ncbi:hypothetical protein EKO29_09285 [Colwellia sp. Arc7-635]|uniref:BatA domain-containing protein n=1 Tax=Colwellia sp. Arc7-635 TaxID=2497879 RepID=UPI000F851410|nr:BatA domain-containing protein [Colwellia sp. Arc7-635]AZQ84197.1 hypothetical protein EKO29_09285 [Colwellia sp. Arc7-635]